jgi:O-antigen ligase
MPMRENIRHPLWTIGALWPLATIIHLLPGFPRPVPTSFLARQETWIALLLTTTLLLLLRQVRQTGAWPSGFRRGELFPFLPLLSFVLWSGASALWARSPSAALNHTLTWGAYFLFFLLMRHVAGRPRLLRASLAALAALTCLVAVLCALEYWSGSPLLFRYYLGLGEPAAVTFPLFFALALGVRRPRAALFCGATASLAWLTTTLSLERAPTIAAAAGLLLVAACALRGREGRGRRLRRAALVVITCMLLTALQTAPSFFAGSAPSVAGEAPKTTVIARLAATSSATDTNTHVRFLFWGVAIEMLRERPIIGVGANNYEVAFPEARAQFSAKYPDSPLVNLNEAALAQQAHNEYLQIAAELGAVGIFLFAAFAAALLWVTGRALFRAPSPLAVGASASLLVFAVSSGATSVSFRYMGSGLLFFFAAAVVSRSRVSATRSSRPLPTAPPVYSRVLAGGALAFAALTLGVMCAQAVSITLHGAAQAGADAGRAEQLYRASLKLNPFDAATHYDYGSMLYYAGRAAEAVPHLRYATERGFNTSVCYAHLAAAEAEAGDLQAAERTLAFASGVYPRSVFLRVRHSAALSELGQSESAEREFAAALIVDEGAARGWGQVINNGIDAAAFAARLDHRQARPGELSPEECIFLITSENERRKGIFSRAALRLRAGAR